MSDISLKNLYSSNKYWKTIDNNIITTNTGNLGIGITTPDYKLHVIGTITSTDNICTSTGYVGIGSTAYNTAKLYIYEEGAGTVATKDNGTFVIDRDNVGESSIVFKHKGVTNNYGFIKYVDNADDSSVMTLGSIGGANNKLNIAPGGGATGLVGINKANPLVALDVTGALAVSGNSTIGGTLGVTGNTTLTGTLQANNNVTIANDKTLSVGGNTTLSGTLGVTGATTLSDNVLIGTTFTGTEKLKVNGTISTNNNNINAGTGTITAGTFSGNATSATTASGVDWNNVSGKPTSFNPSSHSHDYAPANHSHNYAAINHSHDYASTGHGHSGIAFGNPIVLAGCLRAWSTSQGKNDSDDVRYFLISDTSWSANSAFNYRVRIDGNLWCRDNGLYTTSDKRIKYDIKELNNNCLKEIRGLKVCKYKNKDILKQIKNNRIYSRGFISQDVKNVLPDAVGINIHENNTIPNIQRLCSISSNILTIYSTSNIILNKNSSPTEFIYDYEANLEDIIEIHIDKLKYNVIINEIISSNIFKINFENKIPNPNIDIIEYKDSSNNISYTSNYNYNYNNVFAYGTIIRDFHTLDYNYIYTTGIGAIKELDNEIINLKNENILLKNKIDLILNRLYP